MLRAHLSWLTGLVCALGTTTGPAAHDDALAQCLASCDQAGSETDQATCRLTCQEEDWAPKEPNITRWKKTELLGGSPDPSVEGGSTTQVVETTGRGRTQTRTETTGRSAAPSSQARPAAGAPTLARLRCQTPCALEASIARRASCRFDCIVRPSVDHAPARISGTAASSTSTSRSSPTSSCRSDCSSRADHCRAGCSADGSDAATCELQCNQVEARCLSKCR